MPVNISFDLDEPDASALDRLVESSGMPLPRLIESLVKQHAAEYQELLTKVEAARRSVSLGDVYSVEQVADHCRARRARMRSRAP